MNHKQLEALKAATQGHTPGPWRVDRQSVINAARDLECSIRGEAWKEKDNEVFNRNATATAHVISAAPDLLAEVERLRGWLDFISENPRGGYVTYVHAQNALSGEEVTGWRDRQKLKREI